MANSDKTSDINNLNDLGNVGRDSWNTEDQYWRQNYSSRPYASGKKYEEFQPAYQYGHQSGQHHMGRQWNDVESDMRTGWDKFEGRKSGGAAWENVKDAVKDAWHRVTGQHDMDTDRMSEASSTSRSTKTY